MHREAIIKNAQKKNSNFVNFYNGYSLKYEYNNKCKEQNKVFERRNIMNYEVAEEAGMRLVLKTKTKF